MTGFQRLVRDVMIYGTGGVSLQLLAFLTVPVFTRVFVPADYGVIETMTGVASILAIFALLNLDSASQRSYFDYTDEEERQRRTVLGTTFVTLALVSGFVGVAGVLASGWISRLFFPDDRFATVIALALAAIPVGTMTTFFLEILRVRHRPTAYVVLSVAGGSLGLLLALVIVGLLDGGLTGYYLGGLLGGALVALVGFAVVRDSIEFRVDWRELRVMLAYGLPLVPVALSAWVLVLIDRFFILHYSGLEELGLYGVAVRLANLLLLGVSAFSLAWSPLMLELHRKDPLGERLLRARVLIYVVAVLSFAAVAVSVYAREFFRVVTDPAFAEAYRAVGMLALAVVAMGANAVTMSGISIARKTRYFARYGLYAVAINVALNFVLIPPFGMEGAALSTLITYAALAAFYYYRAAQIDPAPFALRRVLVTVAVAVALIGAGSFIAIEPLWLSLLAKLPLLLAFPLLLLAFRVVDRDGIRLLAAAARDLAATPRTSP